jgi:hypothetical protein
MKYLLLSITMLLSSCVVGSESDSTDNPTSSTETEASSSVAVNPKPDTTESSSSIISSIAQESSAELNGSSVAVSTESSHYSSHEITTIQSSNSAIPSSDAVIYSSSAILGAEGHGTEASELACFDGDDNDGDGEADCADVGCSEVIHPLDSNWACPRRLTFTVDSIFAIFKDQYIDTLTEWYNDSISDWYGPLMASPYWFINDTTVLDADYASPLDTGAGYRVSMTMKRFAYVANYEEVITFCPDEYKNGSTCGPNDDQWQETQPMITRFGGASASWSYSTYSSDVFDLSYYQNGYLRFDIKSDFDMMFTIQSESGYKSMWLSDMEHGTGQDGVEYGWTPGEWSFIRYPLADLGLAQLRTITQLFSLEIPPHYQYFYAEKEMKVNGSYIAPEYNYTQYPEHDSYIISTDFETDKNRVESYLINAERERDGTISPGQEPDSTVAATLYRDVEFLIDNIYYGDIQPETCIDFGDGILRCTR